MSLNISSKLSLFQRVAFSSDRAACTVAPSSAPKARGRDRAWRALVGAQSGSSESEELRAALCRRDKTLGAPAFRAFIDVMHKTRLFLLDARKPHPPTAFEANGLLAERLRNGLRFHELLSAKASQGSGRP